MISQYSRAILADQSWENLGELVFVDVCCTPGQMGQDALLAR